MISQICSLNSSPSTLILLYDQTNKLIIYIFYKYSKFETLWQKK